MNQLYMQLVSKGLAFILHIAEEHLTLFQHKFNNVEKEISQKTAVEFSVQYSFQKQRTDTLAVTSDNIPFRDRKSAIVF